MTSVFTQTKKLDRFPRLPLEVNIDLTYRCSNDCRHCWLRLPADDPARERELSLEEIKDLADQARALGTRRWAISGGEPMLRPDFPEIFDYLTGRCASYSLNTNGALITPEIARLLTRQGSKMVALYGATAEVHDHVTRKPGSFEATMKGFRLLKEAGAGFTVQLIPMRDNYHQFPQMVELAKSLSRHYRIGAPWLYLSAEGDPARNAEIRRQRLDPRDVVELDRPSVAFEDDQTTCPGCLAGDDRLFAECLEGRRCLHLDPYGGLSFCGFIKDPALRYDLRRGSVGEAWDKFIPALAERVRGGQKYLENCAVCGLRQDCRWCPVYAYLEHRDYGAKVDYLCAVAKENKKYKEDWRKDHRAHYQIGGITLEIEADLPITEQTFHPKLKSFKVAGPGRDTVRISHHFSLPDLAGQDLGQRIYSKPPWSIYRKGNSWIYLGISPTLGEKDLHRVAVFNQDHSRGRIYHKDAAAFLKGGLASLTMMPTDQILVARLLAERQGCYLHSSGVIMNGRGLLFVGHSSAGKSTTTLMLKEHVQVLCDDRNIVRRRPDGFRVYGTWSHGDVPEISPDSAPLKAILFIEQSQRNEILTLTSKAEAVKRLIACLIKPLETSDWWDRELALIAEIAGQVPCYRMLFDKSGAIVEKIKGLVGS